MSIRMSFWFIGTRDKAFASAWSGPISTCKAVLRQPTLGEGHLGSRGTLVLRQMQILPVGATLLPPIPASLAGAPPRVGPQIFIKTPLARKQGAAIGAIAQHLSSSTSIDSKRASGTAKVQELDDIGTCLRFALNFFLFFCVVILRRSNALLA